MLDNSSRRVMNTAGTILDLKTNRRQPDVRREFGSNSLPQLPMRIPGEGPEVS